MVSLFTYAASYEMRRECAMVRCIATRDRCAPLVTADAAAEAPAAAAAAAAAPAPAAAAELAPPAAAAALAALYPALVAEAAAAAAEELSPVGQECDLERACKRIPV